MEKRAIIAERAVAERAALVQAALARAAALQRAAVLKGTGAGPASAEGAALVTAALARAAALQQANAPKADELASTQADGSIVTPAPAAPPQDELALLATQAMNGATSAATEPAAATAAPHDTKPITVGWDAQANEPIIVGYAPLAPRPEWLPTTGPGEQ